MLTTEDIEKEYLLVRAKLSLIQRDPSLATQLSSKQLIDLFTRVYLFVCLFVCLGPFVSADEVSTLMVQAGLFEAAIRIANKFTNVTMEPIFEALAARSAK